MWSATHIYIFLMVIQTHSFFIGHIFNQAQLIIFMTLLKYINYLFARGNFFNYIIILCNQFFHASFDCSNIFGCKRTLVPDIIIEAIFNYRSDNHFGFRIQLFNGMTNQMCTGVTNDFDTFFIFGCNDADLSIFCYLITCIYQFAVNLSGNCGFG